MCRTGAQGPPRTWGNTGATSIEEAWHFLDNGRCRRRYPGGGVGRPIIFFEEISMSFFYYTMVETGNVSINTTLGIPLLFTGVGLYIDSFLS